MMKVILKEGDDYEDIRWKKPYESYSYWSCENQIIRLLRIPLDFVLWISEFIKLHRKKYEFEIVVWKKKNDKTTR